MRPWAPILFAFLSASCRTSFPYPSASPPLPTRPSYVLIESTYGETRVPCGDGRIPDSAPILVLIPRTDTASVEVVVRKEAAAGEIVDADLILHEESESLHRLQIRPDSPDVEVLSSPDLTARGAATVPVRFRRARAGKGGIVVSAERVEEHEGITPRK